jgi:hypothetical protein
MKCASFYVVVMAFFIPMRARQAYRDDFVALAFRPTRAQQAAPLRGLLVFYAR